MFVAKGAETPVSRDCIRGEVSYTHHRRSDNFLPDCLCGWRLICRSAEE